MRYVVKAIVLLVVFLGVAYFTLWGTLALWFRVPGPEILRWIFAGAFGLFGIATLPAVFGRRHVRLAAFAAVVGTVLIWWNTLVPSTEGNWSPEVAQQVTGTIEGDILTLQNVRAFEWRTETDVTEKWETRTYDLSQIETLDLFMSYWGGRNMAHLMISFGFADGRYLTWSVEVRREVGESFSPLGDFFKSHSLIVIAAEERDVVGLRSNIQKSEVYMFRLRADPEKRREFIEAYVRGANGLSEDPKFFNSLFTNCSRSAILLARSVGAPLPVDWRILVNGYFPDYLYERGAITNDIPLEEVYRLGDITERARSFGLNEGFSEVIRQGVPMP